jgi:hypothetical protein
MFGMTIYAAVEPSAVRELLRNPNNSTTFAVPFNTFNILLDDWTHMVDGQLHEYWRRVRKISRSCTAHGWYERPQGRSTSGRE